MWQNIAWEKIFPTQIKLDQKNKKIENVNK